MRNKQYENKKRESTYMGLAERLALVSASGMVEVVSMLSLHTNVVNKRDVADLDLLKGPVVSEMNETMSKHTKYHIITVPDITQPQTTHHFPNNFTSVAASAILKNYKSIKLINVDKHQYTKFTQNSRINKRQNPFIT